MAFQTGQLLEIGGNADNRSYLTLEQTMVSKRSWVEWERNNIQKSCFAADPKTQAFQVLSLLYKF